MCFRPDVDLTIRHLSLFGQWLKQLTFGIIDLVTCTTLSSRKWRPQVWWMDFNSPDPVTTLFAKDASMVNTIASPFQPMDEDEEQE
jgi:hypothetical protein